MWAARSKGHDPDSGSLLEHDKLSSVSLFSTLNLTLQSAPPPPHLNGIIHPTNVENFRSFLHLLIITFNIARLLREVLNYAGIMSASVSYRGVAFIWVKSAAVDGWIDWWFWWWNNHVVHESIIPRNFIFSAVTHFNPSPVIFRRCLGTDHKPSRLRPRSCPFIGLPGIPWFPGQFPRRRCS